MARGAGKQKSGWQWGKEPKPELLSKLPKAVVESTIPAMKAAAPTIAAWLVDRIRGKGMLARFGRESPLPGYSKPYTKLLTRAGYPTKPDQTLTGSLLDHLKGRVKLTKNLETELIINPYGTASGRAALKLPEHPQGTGPGGETRESEYWKPPYTYTIHKTGQLVSVAGQWQKWPAREMDSRRRAYHKKKEADQGRKKTMYNAHLATYLSYRLGYGKWQKGGKPPSSFLTLTTLEVDKVWSLLRRGLTSAASGILKYVAGR